MTVRRIMLAAVLSGVAWVATTDVVPLLAAPASAASSAAQAVPERAGGEASLVLPDLSRVTFHGIDGHTLLLGGLVICALGLLFGLVIQSQLRNLAVHQSMREMSDLIYET